MARPNKIGLDYFPLDCVFDDDKIALIESDFGLKGFAIIVKLWQKIYSSYGYYCEWTPKISKLFKRDNQISDSQLLEEVLKSAFEEKIFSLEMYEKHAILTSRGIQNRYLKACVDTRRKRIDFNSEYLLIDISTNLENVYINGVCAYINENKEVDNPQKEKERENEIETENKHERDMRGRERKGEPLNSYGMFNNVYLTESEYEKINNTFLYGFGVIERTSKYLNASEDHYENHYTLALKIAENANCIKK